VKRFFIIHAILASIIYWPFLVLVPMWKIQGPTFWMASYTIKWAHDVTSNFFDLQNGLLAFLTTMNVNVSHDLLWLWRKAKEGTLQKLLESKNPTFFIFALYGLWPFGMEHWTRKFYERYSTSCGTIHCRLIGWFFDWRLNSEIRKNADWKSPSDFIDFKFSTQIILF